MRHITRSQKSETPTHYISKLTEEGIYLFCYRGRWFYFMGAPAERGFRGIITGPIDELHSPSQASCSPTLGITQDQQRSPSNLMGESVWCYWGVTEPQGWSSDGVLKTKLGWMNDTYILYTSFFPLFRLNPLSSSFRCPQTISKESAYQFDWLLMIEQCNTIFTLVDIHFVLLFHHVTSWNNC